MGTTIQHFESQPCSRCGGSGTWSYTRTWGTTCFKCGTKPYVPGSGWTLTKVGSAAHQAWIDANRETVPAGSIVVGDVIADANGGRFRVDEIERKAGTADDNFGASKSGNADWTYFDLRLTRVHNVTGERYSRLMSGESSVQRLTPGRLALPPEMEPGTKRGPEMRAYVKAASEIATAA